MQDGQHSHEPEAIKARLNAPQKTSYIREWVYGGIDGVVTTFAITAGVVGASLSPAIVLILGLANLVGDGFSMAAGCYSSTKTDVDNYNRLRKIEGEHIANHREGEKEEIRQIYTAKGFDGDNLETIVETITADKERWIDEMMASEYGMPGEPPSPMGAAMHTFMSFVVCGAVPLLPFLLKFPASFELALAASALTFFAIGALKSRWSQKSWAWHGVETSLVGLSAAGIAFVIGYALRGLAA